MNTVIIGSGNVATHLAKALYQAGISIAQVWSQKIENAQILARQVEAKPINDLSQISQADVCFISVKDDALASIVAQLSHFKGIITHTAGAISIDIFKNKTGNYGVFYPLQTFSKTRDIPFINIPLCVEANQPETLTTLLHLAKKISNQVFEIDTNQRKILHLAAVFACNFPNYLYHLSAQLLNAHQLNFEMIRPLILETAQKVQHHLPVQVQTGPAIRGDVQTIQQHLALLNNQPAMAQVYTLLTNSLKSSK